METPGFKSWNHIYSSLQYYDFFCYSNLLWVISGVGEGVGLNKYDIVNNNSIKMCFHYKLDITIKRNFWVKTNIHVHCWYNSFNHLLILHIFYSFAKISFKIILIYNGGQGYWDRSYPSLSEFCGYYQLTSSSSSPILAGILTRQGDSRGSGHPSLQANEGLSIPLLPSLLPLFLQHYC